MSTTAIPALASEVVVDGDIDGIQVTGGAGGAQTLSTSFYYYFVSNVDSDSNGRSLLHAILTKLNTSDPSVAWTVLLNASYKVQITHDGVSSKSIVLDTLLATNLGFTTGSISVPNGATGAVASYPSKWWWTPDMPISETGPTLFDPAINWGVPEAGQSEMHWSPDGTAAYVENGALFRAQYRFLGVEGYAKIRDAKGDAAANTNKDWEGFWTNNVRKGRRLLMWRNRDNATLAAAPIGGVTNPRRYVIYQPSDSAVKEPLATPSAPPNLVFWDVLWDLVQTADGETIFSDPG